ncbi:acetolactate decarboxylase [Persicitalea sp.]|uniref:acetolactate decarboxylase n=1 Tax=Persicitalea sp. TaxID=3100273 RepID=UPI003592E887
MKIYSLCFFLSLVLLASCKRVDKPDETTTTKTTQNDTYFQYSIWWAFTNKVFDADLSVETLKTKGDVGLGSFNMLDGEMVMVDGTPFRIREDGVVSEGADADKLVYANAVHFQKNDEFEITQTGVNFDSLQARVKAKLPSPNYFYAFVIKGKFARLKCGGLTKQQRPFVEGLDVLIPNRPVFEADDISGTMVGFYCPDFIGNINTKGFHFHFISDDRKFGGHVMEMVTSGPLVIQMDQKADYNFQLPDNADFGAVSFEKEFQYKKD